MGAQSQHHAVDGLCTPNLREVPLPPGLAHPCPSTWPAAWMAPAEKHVAERVAKASPRPPPALAPHTLTTHRVEQGPFCAGPHPRAPRASPSTAPSTQGPFSSCGLISHLSSTPLPPGEEGPVFPFHASGRALLPPTACKSSSAGTFLLKLFCLHLKNKNKNKNPLLPLVSAAPCIFLIEISASHQPPAVYSDSVGFRPAQFCPCQPSAWHQETLSQPCMSVLVQN